MEKKKIIKKRVSFSYDEIEFMLNVMANCKDEAEEYQHLLPKEDDEYDEYSKAISTFNAICLKLKKAL